MDNGCCCCYPADTGLAVRAELPIKPWVQRSVAAGAVPGLANYINKIKFIYLFIIVSHGIS